MAVNPSDSDGESDGGDDGEEWRFSLEDIEQRTDEEDEEGNVAGSLSPAGEITAGDIDLENALFVLVGIALAVLVLVGFMNILP